MARKWAMAKTAQATAPARSGLPHSTIVWMQPAAQAASADVAQRPFRADWAGWTLADILGLYWQGEMPERNVLNPQYRWQPQTCPCRWDRSPTGASLPSQQPPTSACTGREQR